jgi:apolipoprotein N-acyltransferase
MALLSALLLNFCFAPFGQSYLVFVALVPLMMALGQSHSPREAFKIAMVFGIAFFALLLSWLLPLMRFTWLAIPAAIGAVMYCALFYGIWGAAYRRWGFYAVLGWPIMEFVRTVGPLGFSWGHLSHAAAGMPFLAQLAGPFGIYGLSLWIILINFLLARFAVSRKPSTLYMSAELLAVGLIYSLYAWNTVSTEIPLRAVLIQPNIPQTQKWDPALEKTNLDKIFALTEKELASEPDLIVWPEVTLTTPYESDAPTRERIAQLLKGHKTALMLGTLQSADSYYDYNSALLIQDGQPAQSYQKRRLVPVTEWWPLKSSYEWFGNFKSGDSKPPLELGTLKIAPLICFESIFPSLARAHVKQGANLIVSITNDAWFDPLFASAQHLDFLRLRAIENRVPVIHVANTGVSAILDARGKLY